MYKPETTTRAHVLRQLIAERADELRENQGRLHGYGHVHWRQAEAEIMSCREPGFLAAEDSRLRQSSQVELPARQ